MNGGTGTRAGRPRPQDENVSMSGCEQAHKGVAGRK
jgi:hypothetical protein